MLIGLHGHIQGAKPSSNKTFLAKPLLRDIKIRIQIDSLEKGVEAMNKNATD